MSDVNSNSVLILRIRDLIASREFNTAEANRELQSGDGWLYDHSQRNKDISEEIEVLFQKINKENNVWKELGSIIEEYRSELNLSFGLEYSSVVDWVADITPRKGHPKARQYGLVWRGQGHTADDAIMLAIRAMREELSKKEKPNVPVPQGPIGRLLKG